MLEASLLSAIGQTGGVQASSAYVEGEVAVASRSNFNGGVLMGIDLKASPGVLEVLNSLPSGTLDKLEPVSADPGANDDPFAFAAPSVPPGIIVGVEMARALSIKEGDDVRDLTDLGGSYAAWPRAQEQGI